MQTSRVKYWPSDDSKGTLYNATDYPKVQRCLAFVDISSYTSFTHAHGDHAAASMVADFRDIVRFTCKQYDVQIARWLGDGVMLVGSQANRLIEGVYDITSLCYDNDISVHSGLAQGEVVIFEGDDYLGRTVNIAARLSNAANESELYCHQVPHHQLPSRFNNEKIGSLDVKGVGGLQNVIKLKLL